MTFLPFTKHGQPPIDRFKSFCVISGGRTGSQPVFHRLEAYATLGLLFLGAKTSATVYTQADAFGKCTRLHHRKPVRFLYLLLMISLVMPGLSAGNEQPVKLLILGDSLTAGYGVQTSDAFPAVLENRLQKKGYAVKVMAAGKDGATSASGLSRLKWHLRRNPDLLLLELGGNDGLRSIDPAVTRKNLANIIEHAQSEGLPVILAGMKMPLNYPKAYRSRFEAVFPELASKYDTPFIPFLLKGVGGQPEYNLPDQIHPNEAGHQKVAGHLLPHVEKVLHQHFLTAENSTSEKP